MTLEEARQETPACLEQIHLNNAGASLPPEMVLNTVTNYLNEEARRGGYELMADKQSAIQETYEWAGRVFNCSAENVAFVGSASDALYRALSAIPFEKGDVILTTEDDYSSNQLAFLSLVSRMGLKLLRAPRIEAGGVDEEALCLLIRKHKPKCVCVTHMPTNHGLIQPLDEIGAECSRSGAYYIVDACQTFGQIPLDVQKYQCDFLCVTGRKWMRGPRGTGLLYVSDRVLKEELMPLYFDLMGVHWTAKDTYRLKEGAKRFEWFERSVGLQLGLGAAMRYYMEAGPDWIWSRLQELAVHTRKQLSLHTRLRIIDEGEHKGAIVSSGNPDMDLHKLKNTIKEAGINVGFGRRENALIDLKRKGHQWFLRISPHYYNTIEEIDQCISVLEKL